MTEDTDEETPDEEAPDVEDYNKEFLVKTVSDEEGPEEEAPNIEVSSKEDLAEKIPEDNGYKVRQVSKPRIIYRGGWGALRPVAKAPALSHPVSKILFTYTGTKECETSDECSKIVQDLQKRHMKEKGMPDIQYNFLVGGDLNIYEGRGWHTSATKDPAYASLDGQTIDIAYIGDFSEKDPSNEVLKAGGTILDQGLMHKYITEVLELTPYRKKTGEPPTQKCTFIDNFHVSS